VVILSVRVAVVIVLEEQLLIAEIYGEGHRCYAQTGEGSLKSVPS
jgi:hypothetical protein